MSDVLVFLKGDPKKATAACGVVEYGDLGLNGEAEAEDTAPDGQAPPPGDQPEDDYENDPFADD